MKQLWNWLQSWFARPKFKFGKPVTSTPEFLRIKCGCCRGDGKAGIG